MLPRVPKYFGRPIITIWKWTQLEWIYDGLDSSFLTQIEYMPAWPIRTIIRESSHKSQNSTRDKDGTHYSKLTLSLSLCVSHGDVLFENQLIIHTLSCCNPPLFWLISVSLDKTCWHLKTNIAEFPCMLLLCLFNLVGQPHPFGSDGFLNTFVVRGPKLNNWSPILLQGGTRRKSFLLMAKKKMKKEVKVVLQTRGQ